MIRGEYINALDYMTAAQVADVLSPTGGTVDVTAAVQAAIDASWNTNSANNNPVFLPAGRYLITDTINLHSGTKIKGVNVDYGGLSGAQSLPNKISDSKGTVIIFAPTTQKSLFKPILPKGGSNAWGGIGIEGLNIWGNSTTSPSVTTSLYAFDFDDVQMSFVTNVGVMGFVSAIREANRCQNNSYQNIYIQSCTGPAILYSASTTGVEPTDTLYFNVHVWDCLNGVQMINTAGTVDPLQIRFNSCFFASLSGSAFIITSGAREISFTDCYCEGVGLDVGLSGTACFLITGPNAAPDTVNLNIIGGQYAGATGVISPVNGIFLKTENCGGVNVIAVDAKRFTTGIVCDTGTRANSIYLANPFFETISGSVFDASSSGKLIGTYRTVASDAGNDVVVVRTQYLSWTGSAMEILAPSIRLGDGSSTSAYPGGDNTMELGLTASRWQKVHARSGMVVTTPNGSAKYIIAVDNAGAVTSTLVP